MKSSIQKLEDSIEFTQGEVDTLKEQVKENSKKHETDVELLQQKVAELALKLKEEVERNTNIEQYTRRENLRFNKIPESEDENCKAIISMSFQASVSTTLKSVSMQCTGSERRPKIDAGQLLPGSFVERTGTAFGLKEVRLSNPVAIPTRI